MPGRFRQNICACLAAPPKSNGGEAAYDRTNSLKNDSKGPAGENCANKNIVPEIVVSQPPAECVPTASNCSIKPWASNFDEKAANPIELSNQQKQLSTSSASNRFIPSSSSTSSTTKMVASPIEQWSEENSGWAQPKTTIKTELGQTMNIPWSQANEAWNFEMSKLDNSFQGQNSIQSWGQSGIGPQGNWGDIGGGHFDQWGGGSGVMANSMGNGGTIVVVSGLMDLQLTMEELRTLVNFMAGGMPHGFSRSVIGVQFLPGQMDMAFFKMNTEAAARKAQKGMNGFVIGPSGKQLHASVMSAEFLRSGEFPVDRWVTSSAMSNPQFGQTTTGRWNASAMGIGSGWGDTSNNYGEDQSEEMADDEHTSESTLKWKNGASKEEEEEEEEDGGNGSKETTH